MLPVVYPPFLTRVKNAAFGAVKFPVQAALAVPFAALCAVAFWRDRSDARDGMIFGFAALLAATGVIFFGGAAMFGPVSFGVALAVLSVLGAYYGYGKIDDKATDAAREKVRQAAYAAKVAARTDTGADAGKSRACSGQRRC